MSQENLRKKGENIKQIRDITKGCKEELKQFLEFESDMNNPSFGYPLISFTPPNQHEITFSKK